MPQISWLINNRSWVHKFLLPPVTSKNENRNEYSKSYQIINMHKDITLGLSKSILKDHWRKLEVAKLILSIPIHVLSSKRKWVGSWTQLTNAEGNKPNQLSTHIWLLSHRFKCAQVIPPQNNFVFLRTFVRSL